MKHDILAKLRQQALMEVEEAKRQQKRVKLWALFVFLRQVMLHMAEKREVMIQEKKRQGEERIAKFKIFIRINLFIKKRKN